MYINFIVQVDKLLTLNFIFAKIIDTLITLFEKILKCLYKKVEI